MILPSTLRKSRCNIMWYCIQLVSNKSKMEFSLRTRTQKKTNSITLPLSIVSTVVKGDREILRAPFQIAKFMGPTWGPPGTCRPQMGPMLAPWTLLSGLRLPSAYCGCPHVSGASHHPRDTHLDLRINMTDTDRCCCCGWGWVEGGGAFAPR